MPGQNTRTTNDAVREIAYLQRRIADLLSAAGREVGRIDVEIARQTDALGRAIETNQVRGAEVAEALAEYHVNVGDLSSRFSDALEHGGHRVYPTPYKPIRAEWSLVPNRAD